MYGREEEEDECIGQCRQIERMRQTRMEGKERSSRVMDGGKVVERNSKTEISAQSAA